MPSRQFISETQPPFDKLTSRFGSLQTRKMACLSYKNGRRTDMILADKIIDERKKNGWSQEELAEQLGVSRQSVSKWESAGSVPGSQKGHSDGRALWREHGLPSKDELEKENRDVVETSGSDADSPLRRVSMEEANAFLNAKRETAPRLANTVSLFILSPVALLLLAVIAEVRTTTWRKVRRWQSVWRF